jgi:hypothetical protein
MSGIRQIFYSVIQLMDESGCRAMRISGLFLPGQLTMLCLAIMMFFMLP